MKYKFDVQKRKLVECDGQHLTKAQQEYFKDSVLKDRDGDLVQCFHYTDKEFDAFDLDKIGSSQGDPGYCGRGIYLTSMTTFGATFGQNCLECYVDMKNPLVVENLDRYQKEDLFAYFAQSEDYKDGDLPRLEGHPQREEIVDKEALIDILEYHSFKDERLTTLQKEIISSSEYNSFKESGNIEDLADSPILYEMKIIPEFLEVIDERGLDKYIEAGYLTTNDLTSNQFHYGEWVAFAELLTDWAKENGYDGILSENSLDMKIREIVVFSPNQIKSVDNLYPTKSDNFRDNSKEYLQDHLKDMSLSECMKLTKHIKKMEKQEIPKDFNKKQSKDNIER